MKIGDKGLARDSKVSLCPFYFPITSFSNKNPGRSDPRHFPKKNDPDPLSVYQSVALKKTPAPASLKGSLFSQLKVKSPPEEKDFSPL